MRRDEDVIHTGTSHCNVMALSSTASDGEHKYCYARVLGIFHANAVYVGEGTKGFDHRRLEFLWVRWFMVGKTPKVWPSKRLDCVYFPPMADDDSFGFLDPADVVRGCHIIPLFSKGEVHPDGVGMSLSAKDSKDWRLYCINR